MPELPEVETVRRGLLPAIGSEVVSVWGSELPLYGNSDVDLKRIINAVNRATVHTVERRGKYVLIGFSRNAQPTADKLVIHLGMSGRLRLVSSTQPRVPHTHIVIGLSNGDQMRQLRYSDPRRFGQVFIYTEGREQEHPGLACLGIDPLCDCLTGQVVHTLCQKKKRAIKGVLLDQSAIAGIGNIYASESLWMAQIHPKTVAAKLSRPRCDRLAQAIYRVIYHALDHGGTSLKDFVDADGRIGDHGDYLCVYGRDGQPCPRDPCMGTIHRTMLQGRATFYCPRCQK